MNLLHPSSSARCHTPPSNPALIGFLSTLLALGLVQANLRANDRYCDVCGHEHGRTIYTIEDKWEGTTRQCCATCTLTLPRCSMCGLPTTEDRTSLADGRFFCSRDSRLVILDSAPALEICAEARIDLGRLFSRFLSFPETNIVFEIVDRLHMDSLYLLSGADRTCPEVNGYFRVRSGSETNTADIKILSGMRPAQLRAVYAHELTHAWLHQHLPKSRDLSRDAEEGFCELVAYLLLQDRGETREIEELRRNRYTRGQVHLLINAETELGFNAVMEWVRNGADPLLDPTEPDRIRRLARHVPAPTPAPEPFTPPPAPAPIPVPDKLRLTGLLASGKGRVALVNGSPLQPGEATLLRWSTNEAMVRCLEVRSNAAVVLVAGEAEPRVLALASDAP